MAQYDKMISGYYTADGNAKTLVLPFAPDWFEVRIQGNSSGDNWTSSAATGVAKEAYWYQGMASDSALVTKNTDSAATDTKGFVSSSGFKPFDSSSSSQFGSPLTVTSISQANPAVVALSSTSGLATGDVVLLTNSTGQLQLAGLPFQIASLVANTSFTLAFLSSSAFGAAASAGFVKKVLFPSRFLPKLRYITAITKASSAVLTFSTSHGYAVGQTLRLSVPSQFGMVEADQKFVTISAINTSTNTVTVNMDSSAYTTFAYPTSAIAANGVSFPMAEPVGEQPDMSSEAFYDNNSIGMILGTNVAGPASALVLWKAGKSLKVYSS